MAEGIERKLAAVLAADVAGYSRLMSEDEAGTLSALRNLRTEVFGPIVDQHQGVIVKSMGDGWLVEFASVADAVSCAIEIQERLSKDESIKLRIGVHLGDITHEEEDIFGDGVNIAARLQEAAQPGGIVISDIARRSIDGKLAAVFVDLGARILKNITEPITAFGWGMTTADGAPLPLEKPTLVVSPFKSLSEDPDSAYFAEGLCEDIATGLSKNSALVLVSGGNKSAGESFELSVSEARILGAGFLLYGSVRRLGNRTRVTAQLTDTNSGSRIWAERFDREMDDLFDLQDDVVSSIVHALGAADGVIETTARRKSLEAGNDTGSAYDCYLQGRHYFYKHGDAEFDRAEERYLKAIELDENFAPAFSALAWLYFVQFKLFRSKAFEEIRSQAIELALKALHLDKKEFRAHWVLGGIYLHDGNHDQSIAEFEKALQKNNNDSNLLSWSAE